MCIVHEFFQCDGFEEMECERYFVLWFSYGCQEVMCASLGSLCPMLTCASSYTVGNAPEALVCVCPCVHVCMFVCDVSTTVICARVCAGLYDSWL